jgi:hypothetical protein
MVRLAVALGAVPWLRMSHGKGPSRARPEAGNHDARARLRDGHAVHFFAQREIFWSTLEGRACRKRRGQRQA